MVEVQISVFLQVFPVKIQNKTEYGYFLDAIAVVFDGFNQREATKTYLCIIVFHPENNVHHHHFCHQK